MKTLLCLFICSAINFSVVVGQGAISDFPCVTKLMPCQPYLFDPKNVAATCCMPVREIISNELGCICKVFKNVDFMKGLNVTAEQVLELPKACGLKNVTPSICNSVTTDAPGALLGKAGAPAPAKVSKNEGIRKTPYWIVTAVGGAVLMLMFNSAFN